MDLVREIAAYSDWRKELAKNLQRLMRWLEDNDCARGDSLPRLQQTIQRLRADKIVVAFVAEFSRGKSELINALFFADCGERVLPSTAGRTTMCPTEIAYDPSRPVAVDLLPVETRTDAASVFELKQQPAQWRRFPLDPAHPGRMAEALRQIGAQSRLDAEAARRLGFAVGASEDALCPDAQGQVDVPCWRHALINFPHPLLEQGLVIYDTPGLNAIGAEPELTLSLLPSADAIVFVLAADTGVTRSDLRVWREHVAPGPNNGRHLVVLNKIDGLWDGLRTEAAIDAELARQVWSSAAALDIAVDRVLPVSAQKGLVAKIYRDKLLLERSRLPALEQAIAQQLLGSKQAVVRAKVASEAEVAAALTRGLLQARLGAARAQAEELSKLRGKNQKVVQYALGKAKAEQSGFEESVRQYHAVRAVFAQLSRRLLRDLGADTVREVTRKTRESMRAALFSAALSAAMRACFAAVRPLLAAANRDVGEITQMLSVMHRRFNVDHGMALEEPKPFSLSRHEEEIDALEQRFETHINTLFNLLTREKHDISQRFFETVASRLRRIFELANRDVQRWLRRAMAPLEAQVREAKTQMQRRLESIQQVQAASAGLDERIAALKQEEETLRRQLSALDEIMAGFDATRSDTVRMRMSPELRIVA